jgi:flavin reductase (DIM6/NTAB) family NADH-FMN oxidoreductase RutF
MAKAGNTNEKPGEGRTEEIQSDFRMAMRQLGASVSIVTTKAGGDRCGITVTSVCSLSMEPPSLLVCINRHAAAHDILASSKTFAINVLSEEQRKLSELFAGRIMKETGEARFAVSEQDWTSGRYEMPILKRALTSVVCERQFSTVFGTHSIIVGTVVEVALRHVLGTPLIYADGAYRNLFPEDWSLSVV